MLFDDDEMLVDGKMLVNDGDEYMFIHLISPILINISLSLA
jgi:hypothetical protein